MMKHEQEFAKAVKLSFLLFSLLASLSVAASPQGRTRLEEEAKGKAARKEINLTPTYNEFVTLNRDDYLAQFKTEFQKEFCWEKSPFRECYDVTEKKCKDQVLKLTSACAKQIRLPSSINLDTQEPAVSEKMGNCLGRNFAKAQTKQRHNNSYCNRRDVWLRMN